MFAFLFDALIFLCNGGATDGYILVESVGRNLKARRLYS